MSYDREIDEDRNPIPGQQQKLTPSQLRYINLVEIMRTLDPDDQDWGFTLCEECGSHFDSIGVCRNTMCGNSPDLGVDWE